ncbi:MAG TPA: hypothetical protein VFY36_00910 [Solirubrobacteraceae bacterium]|nr:hypothetical protein [Solirubrobacteraceae bacterium]
MAMSRRVEELDAELSRDFSLPRDTEAGAQRTVSRLGHFASVMSKWTDAFVELELGTGATIASCVADELAGRSQLLEEIKRFDASLITGPMCEERQYWTPIGRSALSGEAPTEGRFIVPHTERAAAVKPFEFGLYTSTANAAGVSMWRAFLGPGGSLRLPLPRYTWMLEIDKEITVAEIGSATAWVNFVSSHPRVVGECVFPDWSDIAQSVDAVHFTLPAIAAAQGFCFRTSLGIIPAAFWDVETTFWLRWCFSHAHGVESASV